MVDGVVLDVELLHAEAGGEPVRFHERREARMKSCAGIPFDGEQLTVSPEVLRTSLDRLARDRAANRVVVERNFERTETLGADPERAGRVLGVAQMAAETECHE